LRGVVIENEQDLALISLEAALGGVEEGYNTLGQEKRRLSQSAGRLFAEPVEGKRRENELMRAIPTA